MSLPAERVVRVACHLLVSDACARACVWILMGWGKRGTSGGVKAVYE